MINDPMFGTYAAIAVVLAVVVIYGFTRLVKKPEETAPSSGAQTIPPVAQDPASVAAYAMVQGGGVAYRPELEEAPRCVCGRQATTRGPKIERGRGAYDWLRELFALPPRYKRVVPITGPLTVCDSHAHVADSLVEEFIHVRVRGMLTKAYREIATEAAAFEQEMLAKLLAESLTDEQKRELKREAARKNNTNVVPMIPPAPKTGSEE